MQNPKAWRTARLLFVWPLTLDLSGMGDPTRTSKGPASKALRLTATRKPPHHIKVAIYFVEVIMGSPSQEEDSSNAHKFKLMNIAYCLQKTKLNIRLYTVMLIRRTNIQGLYCFGDGKNFVFLFGIGRWSIQIQFEQVLRQIGAQSRFR